ncbi:KxYKxGKxW signal peptide domain-containing protein [Limosilactobacillus reuteri]|uniref:mucin-binding protein n=1 Tax=Limosilactobacillus reuteri TaxID=1598 RepID=UPI00386CE149
MLRNNYFGETKTHYKLYKCGKNWAVMGISLFSLGLGMLVTSQPVSADVTATSTSSSAVRTDAISASSSSAAKAETTSASSSSAAKAETTSASSSSAAKAETTSASSSSAAKAETTSASSSSAAKADVTSAGGKQSVAQIATNVSKNSAIVTTKFAQNYGRKVLAGSVTNTGFSVSDPDYPSGMWIDPDNSHYSYEWLQAKYGGNQIVFSTNRTGDGIVYVTELSASNKVLKQYTLNQNTQVTSAVFDSTIYYNDVYFEMVRSYSNSFVTKYNASEFDNNYYDTLSYFVPKLITQTTYYVDKDGKQITDSNGNPVAAYTQKGLVGQNYTTSDVNVVNGYYAIAPANSNGVMSPYGEIGASYVKNFHNGVVITYTQTGSDGTMSASIARNGRVLKTWTSIEPSDPTIMYQLGYTTYGIKNPYIPQTFDIKYVYNKLGHWIVSNPDGSITSIIYPNDPSDPTKIADSSVPDYPVIAFIPGYTPEDHMGTPLVPVDPDDRTKGYIPPTPSDNGTDTTITYTADKQKGSVSYVDDTTGKTLKTDSISGTTGSKSSYSTSGSIADYKKQGYELVTDGYPADLTFDNDDTSDQNFTVHLKHQNIQSTEAKTLTETIHYQGAGNQTPADNTAQVTFTRQVSTDTVTGEKTYGSWSADQSFAAVTSPVIKGYTPDQAEIGAQTVSGDSSDLDFTVVYAKNAPTITTESKTINETIHYVYKDGTTAHDDYVAKPVEFTREVSTDAVTGEKTYGSWSADQSFAAVTSPVIKGYTPDQAEIGAQTVSGDSSDLDFTVVYAKNAPTITTESKTINETIHYVYKDGTTAHDDYVAKPVEFTREVSTDAVTGEKTYGSWSADQSFAAVTSPVIKGYTPDQAEIGAQTVSGDSSDLDFTVVYAKNAPTITTESKTINETIHYVYKDGTTAHDDYVAKPVEFTREVSTDAVTGEKTYGSWSADQSFAAVTSPVIKGYTPDQAEIGAQTVSGDSSDLDFTVVYAKNAPTITTESKTINETIHYVYKDGTTAHDDYVAKPVEFTREVSTDAVTGEKTYGSWSADQSFAAVTSPVIKGYTPDQAEIGAQTVSGDSSDLDFTVVYAKNAPTITTESKTINETIHYVYKDGTTAHDDYVAKPVEFTREVSTDAVTGEKTYGSWSADQSFAAVTSPVIKGYTPDQAEIGAQTVSGDSSDLDFTVVYAKNAPTITTESKTINETIHYVYKDGTTAHDDYVAKPVEFTRQVSTDAVTGEKTYGSWSADQSFAAVTSPVIKGYTPDQAEIGAQTVSGDSSDLDFTVVYAKNAPTITTESKTINETIHYVYKDGTTAHDDYVAKPVEFTREVSTDAVTGEKTYGSWSADQSFAAVTSPVIKGYTPDQAEIGAQTVSGDSSDLDFTVVYAKNAPTITTESKTINETIHYVYKDGTTAHDDYVAKPVEFTREVSTDAVTGEKTYGSWSADQSFAAVTSPVIKGYTPDQAEIGAQTVSGDSSDLDFTVVYAKNAPTITTESKTINETIHYVYKDGTTAHDDYVAKPVEFTREVSTDAVTGEKTYGSWSADQSFAAVTSPVIKGYTPDQAEIGAQTVSGDSSDLDFTVVYAKNAPTITTESKTINETIHYVYKDGTTAHDDYVAKPVEFTREVSTDAVTGEKTYGSWSADQSFAAVTSPVIKGYTPDQAEIGAQTVSGDSSDLDFTVVYAKNAPTITTESKTINETIHYVYKDGTTAHDDYVAKPVEFTRVKSQLMR